MKRFTLFFALSLSLLALLSLAAPAHSALAQTGACVVTSSADDPTAEIPNGSEGTLRYLLADSTCSIINFAGDITIHLASTLTIGRSMTIDGGTNHVVISGDTDGDGTGDVGVFSVSARDIRSLVVIATLSNLTIEKGYDGAIVNGGRLTVNNCTFSGNTNRSDGGAIGNIGGGPGYPGGSLLVTNSTFTGNTGQHGGAVFSFGIMSVYNSTFADNSAKYGGGGIFGIGSLAVINSTFSGNESGSGAGGILFGVVGEVRNNLFVKGTSSPNCSGTPEKGSNNLADDDSCGTTGFTNSSSILLGPLGSYGGSTQTFPLLPGSAAIDAGDGATCLSADQRGVSRVGTCDIGAFESQGFALTKSTGDNQSASVYADFSAPLGVTVSANAEGEPIDGGRVTFTPSADVPSATITGSPVTISGGQASVTAVANDTAGDYTVMAGAAGAESVALALTNLPDTTAPTAAPSQDPAANENGWNSTDVTVTWHWADKDGSGIDPANCTDTSVSSGEGEITLTASCKDRAGNLGSASYTVKVDKTPPTAALAVTAGKATVRGWYTSDVTVSTSGTDPVSPVTCTPDQYQTTETTGAVFSGSCTDAAGLSTDAAPLTVKLDKTPPSASIELIGTLGDNGWYVSDVTYHFVGFDDISSPVTCPPDHIENRDGMWNHVSNCTNDAGLRTFAHVSMNRDATPPTNVTGAPDRAPDSGTWYNHPVNVVFKGEDATAGIASCSNVTYDGPDGENITVTGTCKDVAGNTSAAVASSAFNYDATAPTLNPSVSPNPVLLNGSATASPNAADGLSGVASASCDPVDTSTVGAHSVTCTATDNAGNTSTAAASYMVLYQFVGFAAPVENPGVLNVAKAGQGIPFKWRLLNANGAPVTNLASVKVTVSSLACTAGTTADQIEEYATGASGLQNLGDGYYQFNWAMPKTYAGSCKTAQLDLGEGTGYEHTALFQFVK